MSILIGKHINALLRADSDIQRALGSRIYPVAIPQAAPAYPFAVYQNLGTHPDYTKDGRLDDTVSVNVVLVHPSYTDGIELANRIRYIFEGVSAAYSDFAVSDCSLSGTSEDYDPELEKYVFVINLTFKTFDK